MLHQIDLPVESLKGGMEAAVQIFPTTLVCYHVRRQSKTERILRPERKMGLCSPSNHFRIQTRTQNTSYLLHHRSHRYQVIRCKACRYFHRKNPNCHPTRYITNPILQHSSHYLHRPRQKSKMLSRLCKEAVILSGERLGDFLRTRYPRFLELRQAVYPCCLRLKTRLFQIEGEMLENRSTPCEFEGTHQLDNALQIGMGNLHQQEVIPFHDVSLKPLKRVVKATKMQSSTPTSNHVKMIVQ